MRFCIQTALLLKPLERHFSTSRSLANISPVETIHGHFGQIDVKVFRERAFSLEKPLLISKDQTYQESLSAGTSYPAAAKWFRTTSHDDGSSKVILAQDYLSQYGETILPYEAVNITASTKYAAPVKDDNDISVLLARLIHSAGGNVFHRFNAPLSVFLQAYNVKTIPQRLYIAQAQISDLPRELQEDLPTPALVKQAGKGDIYDANIWIGVPPTLTPLHKDPNPNLFVQLGSRKRVRIFEPKVGAAIFRQVQASIGQSASATFRGDEMMEGPERYALDEAVWGATLSEEGFEATLEPEDALFIPKDWWHSIKSEGEGVNGSVNWWFR
ncbi:hypothetical protein B0O99DRAFT_631858 [Bisporella sp. PMI_857]|nr:hypothetical protein B0O99DRAFT_631858 [Bisporella sp. PMI_857]